MVEVINLGLLWHCLCDHLEMLLPTDATPTGPR
jgi:hypothetical protein